MDIVLLATVDGKFHALNRTTGVLLWSMNDEKLSYLTDPSLTPSEILTPLVQTKSPSLETVKDDDDEFYIVEPQSGAIYVLPPSSAPHSTISKLPYTVPKLVEMAPFVFPEDESR
jgi:serine/threonine-protein kinase/endoribonuclease IRE1